MVCRFDNSVFPEIVLSKKCKMETKKQGILGLQRKEIYFFQRAQKHVIVQRVFNRNSFKQKFGNTHRNTREKKQEHGQILLDATIWLSESTAIGNKHYLCRNSY